MFKYVAFPHSPWQQRGEQEAADLLKMADRNPIGTVSAGVLCSARALITVATSARLHRCARGLSYVVSRLICDENVASILISPLSKLHM